jgi:hypothetical protein
VWKGDGPISYPPIQIPLSDPELIREARLIQKIETATFFETPDDLYFFTRSNPESRSNAFKTETEA